MYMTASRGPAIAALDRGTHRLRVLHVIQNLNYGGMERLLADIVRGIDRSRFEAHVLALQYLGRFAEGLDKVAQLHLAEPMSRWSMLRPESLARTIERIAPDVVHSHSGVWYKTSLAARMVGVTRTIHTEHGRPKPDPFAHRVLDSIAARRTDVVVAVSDRLGQELVRSRVAPARRLRVVHNGVDTDLFLPRPDDGALRGELGLSPDVPIIGSIGRLEAIKGYDVMIDAFGHLLGTMSDSVKPVLVIGGEGSERARLERMIDDRALGKAVHLLGWRNDAQSLYSAFEIFTMSSRSEGTSVSLLEAMSAGLCPVVTDVGGNRAVLGERLSHRLVPSESPRALAAAWRDALGDQARRTEDSVASRARVTQHFDLRAMVDAYERLYEGSA